MKFLSDEWFAVVQERVRKEFQKPTNQNIRYLEVLTDCPGEWDVVGFFMIMKNGIYDDFQLIRGAENLPESELETRATYRDQVQLLKGEISAAKLLLSGKLKVKGKKAKAVNFLSVYDTVKNCKIVEGMEF